MLQLHWIQHCALQTQRDQLLSFAVVWFRRLLFGFFTYQHFFGTRETSLSIKFLFAFDLVFLQPRD
jgi:hypothetical protein